MSRLDILFVVSMLSLISLVGVMMFTLTTS
jgi:hypothetical protein